MVIGITVYVGFHILQLGKKIADPRTRDAPFDSHGNGDMLFDCTNLNSIKIVREIGRGIYKAVYLGTYGSGAKVAVKTGLYKSCVANGERFWNCWHDSRIKLHAEIHLSQELKHPNILELLGYCYRGKRIETASLVDEGLVAVYEYGEPLNQTFLRESPIRWRLQAAIDLLDLLHYLDKSPIGSLRFQDLRRRHFLLKNGVLKLIDLEGLHNVEPICRDLEQSNRDPDANRIIYETIKPNECSRLNLSCVDGYCAGFNAMNGLRKMNFFMLQYMLDVQQSDELTLGALGTKRVRDSLFKVQRMLNEPGNYKASAVKKRLLEAISVVG